jgi:predicted alpha/beta-hydrolase family hydrolase
MHTEHNKIRINDKLSVSSSAIIPDNYQAILIIAHGAGQDMQSAFINYLHETIARAGIMTIKFNFPYKELGRKAPDRPPILEATWHAVIDAVLKNTGCRLEQIFLSGKSMGGRYASMIAAQRPGLGGLIVYGYPLHAPGKLDKLRVEHLASIACPMLFFQGTRDSLCKIDVFQPILTKLPNPPELHIIEGGDHSFKVLKKLSRAEIEVWQEITDHSIEWINQKI